MSPRLNRATTAAPDEIIFDAWTPVSFKHVMGNTKQPGVSWLAPTWVGTHKRRLQAYKILQSYIDNSSRFFLNTTDIDTIENRREYGDAALVVGSIVDALLGDEWKVTVDGAEVAPVAPAPVAPATPPGQDPPDPSTPPAKPPVPTPGQPPDPEVEPVLSPESRRAREVQDWLLNWIDLEKLGHHMQEVEHDAVGLGDGVYVVSWSNTKQRPRIQSYDPGFYFPVLDEDNRADQDFPRRVHIAWEEESNDPTKIRVRRITWELRGIEPARDSFGDFILLDDGSLPLIPGDTRNGVGMITRSLPWSDDPVTETCFMTDATWLLPKLNVTVDDFSGGTASYAVNEDGQMVRDLDLLIDFMPVIHVPNTVAIRNHFGRSSMATVLQVLDDLAAADTDLQAASATTGSPPIALGGATMETDNGRLKTYGPGTVFETGEGTMTILDTSNSLDAIIKYVDGLLARLAVNSHLPESVLGRVKPSEVPSGIALALSFGPLESMVRKMRDVRNEKYPTLLKFVLRFALLGKVLPDGELPEARVRFGSFLPSDKSTAVQHVVQLLGVNAISLETALQMLVEAGFPIVDAGLELARIEADRAQKQAHELAKMDAAAKIESSNQPPIITPSKQQGSSPAARGGV